MKRSELEAIARSVAPAVKEHAEPAITEALAPLLKRLVALEAAEVTKNVKAVYDGERTITVCWQDGTPLDGGEIVMPMVIDRGVYQAGKHYQRGDGVTYTGSFWIAQADTDARPKDASEASRAWRLARKRDAA